MSSTGKFWFQSTVRVVGAACVFIVAFANANGQDEMASPKLVICGGGALPDSIIERFREFAGPQPSLVVIPTATSRVIVVPAIQELWQSRGFAKVQVLHSTDRSLTTSPDFSKPLQTATAVWFGGGSQQRIADAYLGTPLEEQLRLLLERGGVIGGTSAGAAIQSRVMIASGSTSPNLSTGFDLFAGAIIDQHFLKRNRIPRLLAAIKAHPELVGFGIDEGTALVVNGTKATVVGQSYVLRIESKDGNVRVDAFEKSDDVPIGPLPVR